MIRCVVFGLFVIVVSVICVVLVVPASIVVSIVGVSSLVLFGPAFGFLMSISVTEITIAFKFSIRLVRLIIVTSVVVTVVIVSSPVTPIIPAVIVSSAVGGVKCTFLFAVVVSALFVSTHFFVEKACCNVFVVIEFVSFLDSQDV